MICDPTVFSSLVGMLCVQPRATAQWYVKQLLGGGVRGCGVDFQYCKNKQLPIPKGWCPCWLAFFLNLTQVRVIWQEGTSIERKTPSDCPVGYSVGAFS